MTRRESDARGQLLQLAAQLIAAATDDRGTLGDRMAERFPWMFALSPEDRETCAHELLDSARASFATGEAHLAAAEMIAWQETATALAAGLDSAPVTWISSTTAVDRP
ncbi:MAG: prevent-host-death protein [Naasia sp.]